MSDPESRWTSSLPRQGSSAPPPVTLRPVRDEDLPILFEHQADPLAARMAAFESRSRPDFEAHWARILGDPSCLARAILLGDRVVGHVGSFELDSQRLVGYWIAREHWGRGVASAALERYLEIETARPLRARVSSRNVGSIRVLRKTGFLPVGEESLEFHGEPMVELVFELGAHGVVP